MESDPVITVHVDQNPIMNLMRAIVRNEQTGRSWTHDLTHEELAQFEVGREVRRWAVKQALHAWELDDALASVKKFPDAQADGDGTTRADDVGEDET